MHMLREGAEWTVVGDCYLMAGKNYCGCFKVAFDEVNIEQIYRERSPFEDCYGEDCYDREQKGQRQC